MFTEKIFKIENPVDVLVNLLKIALITFEIFMLSAGQMLRETYIKTKKVPTYNFKTVNNQQTCLRLS